MTSPFASLQRYSPQVLSILRIVAAASFFEFGLEKYFDFPGPGPQMTPLLYVQGVIEIVGGFLLLVGAFTRVVAFVLSGDMAAAYFMVYFPRSFFPGQNGGLSAMLYCFLFFYLVFAGGGAWSVDRAILKQD
jgi:putative oxidoreductase